MLKLTPIVSFVLCLAAGSSSADLLVGNLSQGNAGGASGISSDTELLANAFTTPSTIPANVAVLESIELRLGSSSGSQTATISLWTDSAGSPGTPLGGPGFNSQSVSGPEATYSFTPTATFLFDPSTTYWVVLQIDSVEEGEIDWGYTFPGQDPGSVAGASINGDAYSSNSGASWSPASGPYLFAVNGTAIPEPSSVTLTLTGMVLAVVNLYRRPARSRSVAES